MSITATASSIIRKTATAAFIDQGQKVPLTTDMMRYVSTFRTDKLNTDFGWFGAIPFPSQIDGNPPVANGLSTFTDTLTPLTYGIDLPVHLDTLMQDQTGTAASIGRGLAAKVNEFLTSRAAVVLEAGTAGTVDTAYDGQFFLDTDHDESGSNQDNDLTRAATGTGTPTVSEFEAGVGDIVQAFAGFTDDQGNPFGGGMGIEIVVPTEQMTVATQALGAADGLGFGGHIHPSDDSAGQGVSTTNTRTTGVTGIFRGHVKWQVNPYLTDASRIYGLRRPGPGTVGPLVLVERGDWNIRTWDGTNSKDDDTAQTVTFRATKQFVIGYGLWQNAVTLDFT